MRLIHLLYQGAELEGLSARPRGMHQVEVMVQGRFVMSVVAAARRGGCVYKGQEFVTVRERISCGSMGIMEMLGCIAEVVPASAGFVMAARLLCASYYPDAAVFYSRGDNE